MIMMRYETIIWGSNSKQNKKILLVTKIYDTKSRVMYDNKLITLFCTNQDILFCLNTLLRSPYYLSMTIWKNPIFGLSREGEKIR